MVALASFSGLHPEFISRLRDKIWTEAWLVSVDFNARQAIEINIPVVRDAG